MAASYDLFGNNISTVTWRDYLTGGEYGPGGPKWAEAEALRKKFRESDEFREQGWDGTREKLLAMYLTDREKHERRLKNDRRNKRMMRSAS